MPSSVTPPVTQTQVYLQNAKGFFAKNYKTILVIMLITFFVYLVWYRFFKNNNKGKLPYNPENVGNQIQVADGSFLNLDIFAAQIFDIVQQGDDPLFAGCTDGDKVIGNIAYLNNDEIKALHNLWLDKYANNEYFVGSLPWSSKQPNVTLYKAISSISDRGLLYYECLSPVVKKQVLDRLKTVGLS